MKWINVLEQLPPLYNYKLVTFESRGIRFVTVAMLEKSSDGYKWKAPTMPYNSLTVKAWADYPEPYDK